MKIAILSIGDELLLGEITDTNATHISAALYDLGLIAERRLTVGDREEEIVATLLQLAEEFDLVIATGGLGPTVDDVTARAAARACGRRLVLNDEALAHLRDFRGGGPLHPANEKQALLPAKALLLPNYVGTAYGFAVTIGRCEAVFLPGVPFEMERMLAESVLPRLADRVTSKSITRTFRIFGKGEAELDRLLHDLPRPDRGLFVAFQAVYPEIRVKLRFSGDDPELLRDASRLLRDRVGDHLVAEGETTIDEVVAGLFRDRGVTLALAESCTGGWIAKRITDMPGSSGYLLEGCVTYSNNAKIARLGVPAETLEKSGAVSRETAMAMARGMRRTSGADVALAVTGVAGPGASEAKPAGTVFIALADRNGCHCRGYSFHGDRDQVRSITVYTALDWLRRYLLSMPAPQQ